MKALKRTWRGARSRSGAPVGFGAPGKQSSGLFSAENGRQPRARFAEGENETESQWGSERPENSPVDCFQRRTGGSPGQDSPKAKAMRRPSEQGSVTSVSEVRRPLRTEGRRPRRGDRQIRRGRGAEAVPQWGIRRRRKQGGSVVNTGASQAAAQRGDQCEPDRASEASRLP